MIDFLPLFVLIVTGVSSMWVFDFIVYSLKSAPKSSTFGRLYWFFGVILLAVCIGYWLGAITP